MQPWLRISVFGFDLWNVALDNILYDVICWPLAYGIGSLVLVRIQSNGQVNNVAQTELEHLDARNVHITRLSHN